MLSDWRGCSYRTVGLVKATGVHVVRRLVLQAGRALYMLRLVRVPPPGCSKQALEGLFRVAGGGAVEPGGEGGGKGVQGVGMRRDRGVQGAGATGWVAAHRARVRRVIQRLGRHTVIQCQTQCGCSSGAGRGMRGNKFSCGWCRRKWRSAWSASNFRVWGTEGHDQADVARGFAPEGGSAPKRSVIRYGV